MAHQSPLRLRVLHAVRLKGFADDDTVASMAGLTSADATNVLGELAGQGLAVKREGRLSGWSLTPDGRATHAKLLAADVDDAACRAAVEDAYKRFLALNQRMLECCTLWQLREVDGQQVPNDHSDAAHDALAIGKLGAIDDEVQPVCSDLTTELDRFADYGPRLRAARQKVETGDTDWFTKPLIDSYHTVWFELHEDLLATLGIERSKEGS
jgi:hypothetical protein